MKPQTRNILIGATLLLVAASLYAKSKIETAIDVFQKVVFKPISIPKNIKLSEPNALGIPQKINFTIDIAVINNDLREFSLSSYGTASLKSIDIYFKDQLIGTASLDLTELTVPSKSNITLQNVAMQGNTLTVLSNIAAFQNMSLADLRFTGIIEILGVDYEFGN